MKKIGIIGGGVWGSALAKILSENNITIFARDKKTVSSINDYKINPKLKYHPKHHLPLSNPKHHLKP